MATKTTLQAWVLEAIPGGSAQPIDVAKHIRSNHEAELRISGDLFFTWQYDMRWAAQRLRDAGRLMKKHGERQGTWDLPT
jgi:hypothetical protein